ncbi:MAG: ATP phosphoribosyltransferase [Candidatus Entotheonella gemina]|uniref:ATP phosphoribosyltransferase n=1 Tax=Candidatus Entotheonella gemina TaxID=1429439 RepID=W4MF05_9BACT|nr:MAG: ATP phosphoribosyltransferase [Candidatus Entotheonella gemina]
MGMASSFTALADGITIALPKGRILADALALLKKAGFDGEALADDSRKLILDLPERRARLLLLRNSDIPTYVEYGAADMGIVGKDILQEQLKDVYEPLDLQFGACRLVVARPRDYSRPADAVNWSHIKVATKYMRLAEEHFSKKGVQVELIYLGGSVELAPLIGLSDYIVDLVQSGRTLHENGLVEVEEIMYSTARLVVNRASQKTKYEPMMHLVHQLRTYLS